MSAKPHWKVCARYAGIAESLPEAGLEFRSALLEFGVLIAECSGKQLTRTFAVGDQPAGWQPSSGVSAHEREALQLAAETLGL
jgi:hypothetical protein